MQQVKKKQKNRLYELSPEMEKALGVRQHKEKTGILRTFFMEENIGSPNEIDCYTRDRFLEYLEKQDITERTRGNYVRAFDNVKLNNIQEMKIIQIIHPEHWFFKQDRIFLLYLPDPQKALSYRKVVNKEDLIMDFSAITNGIVKEQLKRILSSIINLEWPLSERRTLLKPFQCFLRFVVQHKLQDLQMMESHDEQQFILYMNTEGKQMMKNAGKFIEFCRYTIFMTDPAINWQANVWYLDRFQLDKMRVNESSPVRSLSFLPVINVNNRRYLQEYMRYVLGISDLAVSTCRNKIVFVGKFLKYLDSIELAVEETDGEVIWNFFDMLSESEIKDATYNCVVKEVNHFFQFLNVKYKMGIDNGLIQRYRKKVYLEHNNRSVREDVIKRIFEELPSFPERLQMMYLILFCTGIRKSELCMLKRGCFYKDNGETWLRVYQQKAHYEKIIPIPSSLYEEVIRFAEKEGIAAESYLFPGKKGGAFVAGTFSNMMIAECKKRGISCGEYIFHAHGYRHLIATMMKEKETPLQAIREYLGHMNENMTKQYIDDMEDRIIQKQKKYLESRGSFEE